jgi:hypothetical protein
MRAQLSLLSCLSLVVLGGCSDSPTGPDFRPKGSVLVVTPAAGRIATGGTLQLAVSADGSNQKATLLPEVVWSSSDEQVAGVSAKGVVFGRAGGTTDVIAQWNGLRGVARITVVASSNPELKPPQTCTALPISGAKQDASATTEIPTCRER